MAEIPVAFLIGLFGGAHCVGMCGGFVVALSGMDERPGRVQAHYAVYFAGKTFTYMVMGAGAGLFGATLGWLFGAFQDVLSVMLGVLLVVLGLGLVGVLRRFDGLVQIAPVRRLGSMIGQLVARRTLTATAGLGTLNGVLPCGLVYAVLVVAATTGSPLTAALTMAAFGIGTVPALYLVGMGGRLMRPLLRQRLSRVGGVLVIVVGSLTIVRGTAALDALMGWMHAGHDHPSTEQTDAPIRHAH
jgi:uncharacterized protein